MIDNFEDIPPAWNRALFLIARETDPEAFWRRTIDLIMESIGFEAIVVDWNFSVFMSLGGSAELSHNTPLCRQLTLGSLYNELREAYVDGVRFHPFSQIRKTNLLSCVQTLKPRIADAFALVWAVTDFSFARVIIYKARPPAGEDESQAALERLHRILKPLVDRMSEQIVQTRLIAAMTGYLRDIPVGLAFAGWDHSILFANDEGWRQAWIWKTAPRRESFKARRGRFTMPASLIRQLDALKEAWIDAIKSESATPIRSLKFAHPDDPSLQAVASLVQDLQRPLLTPSFVVRFMSGHSQALNQAFEPNPTQFLVLAALTPAERQIATLAAEGLSNKEIALRVGREVSTVKDHLTRIYEKLEVPGRARLLRLLSLGVDEASSAAVQTE